MDPQKLAQLDPKLRDAYQRVMGTTIPEPPAAPSQTQTPSPADKPPATDPISTPQPQPQPEPNPAPSPIVEPTPITPTEEPSVPIQPTTPAPEPQPASLTPEPVVEPQPAVNPQSQSIPNPQPQSTPAQPASNFVQMNSEVAAAPTAASPNFTAPAPQAQTAAIKKKSGIMPILFGFVGLIFIAIYAIFWAKIFNFKLPFLP